MQPKDDNYVCFSLCGVQIFVFAFGCEASDLALMNPKPQVIFFLFFLLPFLG